MTRKQIRLLRALGVDFSWSDTYEDIANNIDIFRRHAQISPATNLQINKTIDREFKNNLKKGMSVDNALYDVYKRINEKQNVTKSAVDVANYKLGHIAKMYKNKK